MQDTTFSKPENSTLDPDVESATVESPVTESGAAIEFFDDSEAVAASEDVTAPLPGEFVESEDVQVTATTTTTAITAATTTGAFTRVLTGCEGVDALLHSHVPSGALVNVDADSALDARRLLQRVGRASARGGKRVAFISVDPGAASLPCAFSPDRSFPRFDSSPSPDTDTSPAPLRSFLVHTFREFTATICGLLEEAPPPDLVVVEGLDYLFQREKPGSRREETSGDGLDRDGINPEGLDPDVLLGEAVARAGHDELDRWFGFYTGVGRALNVPIWVSCSHGDELAPGESRAEAVARAAYYDGLRPFVQACCPYTLRISSPTIGSPTIGSPTIGSPTIGSPTIGSPTIGDRIDGEGETGELSVALYKAARKLGEARLVLPDEEEGLIETKEG